MLYLFTLFQKVGFWYQRLLTNSSRLKNLFEASIQGTSTIMNNSQLHEDSKLFSD
jgi:hypothetical protein